MQLHWRFMRLKSMACKSLAPSPLLYAVIFWLFFIKNAPAQMLAGDDDKFRLPFYLGISGGYGTTTWGQLVSRNKTAAMVLSTPIRAEEGGAIVGFFAGYEFIPAFAIEATYTHYPTAKIFFDPMSIFAFEQNATALTSRTQIISLSGKFMIKLPYTTIRAYSSAGAAGVHRNDYVYNRWLLSPTFGVGFNYNITAQLMLEVGANYTTGSGQSELDPAEHYIPFTYDVFARTAYRF
jgi:hypothetical protein